MKLRKVTAALIAGALLASVAGTAFAAETVGGTVYGLQKALQKAAEQAKDEIQKNLDKAGLSEAEFQQKVEEQVREKLAPVVKEKLDKSGVKDVPANHWAAPSIAVLTEAGLVKPDSQGNVNLNKPAEKKETVAIFAKVLGIANANDSADEASKKAEAAGLTDNTLNVDKPMTRLEVGRTIAKALGLSIKNVDVKDYPFNDGLGLNDTEKKLLIVLYQAGVFKGYPDKSFKPDRELSVAEIAVLIDRILGGAGK